jgi:RNA polymerase sigma-70 factor (ECF subfamily)
MTDRPPSDRAPNVVLPDLQLQPEPLVDDAEVRFQALFDAGFHYIWNTVRRMGVAPCDLEDVTHDVFIDVYRKIDHYDPARPLRPWLFAFAFRAASEYRRRVRRRAEVMSDLEPADRSPLADQVLIEGENRALVARALDAIDLDRRAVFVMHDLDDMAVPEIARALEIPLNTAYSRLRVAREEFVRALKRTRKRQDRR